jgi:ABC-type branched-subunit amino acid transport system ATPase component
MHAASNLAWIIVEHRLPLLVEAVDQVWILRDGEIIHRDSNPDVLKDPEALATHYNLT